MDITRWLQNVDAPRDSNASENDAFPVQHEICPTTDQTKPTGHERPSLRNELVNNQEPAARQDSDAQRHRALASNVQAFTHPKNDNSEQKLLEITNPRKEAEPVFERRKRHKPRSDLYEPYSNARKRRTRHRQTENAGRKRSKPRQRQPREQLGTPGHRLMANFHAQNVPSDRLTVILSGSY